RATIGLAGNDPQLRGTAAGAHSSLGALRGRQGRFAESAEAYATAVALMSEEVGASHPGTALATLGLAQALRGLDRRDEARAAFAAAREAHAAWHGDAHRNTAYARVLEAEFHYLDG